jgi:hypothetical protein
MNALESVADAIMAFEGWKPGSKSYRNRNPGNLRNSDGTFIVFNTFIGGYSSLIAELKSKFSGNNRRGITPQSTLQDLMNVYAPPADGNPTTYYSLFICNWVTKSLGRSIAPTTRLEEIWPVKSS